MITSRRSLSWVLLVTLFIFILFLTARNLGDLRPYYHGLRQTSENLSPLPYGHIQELYSDATNSTLATQQSYEQLSLAQGTVSCARMPDTSNILLIMKTGASESFGKIPTQIMTTLNCLSDYLVFSDMKQKIAGVDIHDSLETVLPEAMEDNSDFYLYQRQKSCPVDQELCGKESGISLGSAAWSLDKYKNIHIAEKVYELRPEYDWYITVDADSYVSWPNLVQWLSRLDPKKQRYLGSATMIGDFPFAHGGSGYVISQAAMREFVGKHSGIANSYDVKIKDACCGDYMLAMALNDTTGLRVENVWPTINGEKPFTIPFGTQQWCHPIVTMHHMNSEEVSSFWDFEQRFYKATQISPTHHRTMVFKDIYEEFVAPKLQDKREDWDNLSEDRYYLDPSARDYESWQLNRAKTNDKTEAEQAAHKSFEDCQKMCEEVEDCFQFRFHGGICAYSRGFSLGKPRRPESYDSDRWTSGWATSKIRAWIQEQGECTAPVWPGI